MYIFFFLPKSSFLKEKQYHVTTVPVKHILTKISKRRCYLSKYFRRASINALGEWVRIIGPTHVTFHSQDKAKVPISFTAAKTQSPLLMHLEYKVMLLDHNFATAPNTIWFSLLLRIGLYREKYFLGML